MSTLLINVNIAALMAAVGAKHWLSYLRGIGLSEDRARASNGNLLVERRVAYRGPPEVFALRHTHEWGPEETCLVDFGAWGSSFGPRAHTTNEGNAVTIERLDAVFPATEALHPTTPATVTIGLDLALIEVLRTAARVRPGRMCALTFRGPLDPIAWEAGGATGLLMPMRAG